MKKEVLPLPQAWEMGMQLPWVYLRSLSRVYLGKTPEGLTMDELLEARFFSNLEEIRIFLSEDGLKAVRLEEESSRQHSGGRNCCQQRIWQQLYGTLSVGSGRGRTDQPDGYPAGRLERRE